MSSDEEPVTWLRNEIEQDRVFAAACMARPMFGSDLDAIAERVARCGAELAILDECEKALQVARTYKDGDGVLALACAKTWLDAVRLLAGGYKYRPGFPATFAA